MSFHDQLYVALYDAAFLINKIQPLSSQPVHIQSHENTTVPPPPNPSWLRFVFLAGDGEWKDRTPGEAWNLRSIGVAKGSNQSLEIQWISYLVAKIY